jgi:hypothetical protein
MSLCAIFTTLSACEINSIKLGIKKVKQSRYRPGVAPEGSRKLRVPDYMTSAQDGGKIVSPTQRPPLPLGNAPGTHFY